MSGPTKTQEIMAVVKEMADSGATQREIAVKAATGQGFVSQALAVLRGAPDLADAVSAGEIGLKRAYRTLKARQTEGGGEASAGAEPASRPPEPRATVSAVSGWTPPPRYLTVAEVAAVLRVSKSTAYQLVSTGEIRSIRVGRTIRIPEPAVRDYLGGQVATPAAGTADAGERLHRAGHDARAMPQGDPGDWIRIAAQAGASAEEIADAGRVQASHVRQVLNANGAYERLRRAGHAARGMPLGDPDDWIRIAAQAGATTEEIADAGGVQANHVRQVLDANGEHR